MREWLKTMRENQNIKQNEMSKRLGMTQCAYSLIENGKRQPKMTIELAQKLAAIFGVTLEFILENETKN